MNNFLTVYRFILLKYLIPTYIFLQIPQFNLAKLIIVLCLYLFDIKSE